MALHTLWHLFNLRESPFFQQTLRAGQDRYPIELFVGRQRDAERLLRTVAGSPASSRQTVHGPVGVGKTTLVEYVKAQLAAERPRVLSYPTAVLVQASDTADKLALKVLSHVYDAVVSNADDATRALPPVETARQLIRAFKVTSGGGGVSLGIPGVTSVGANLSRAQTYVTPSTVQPLDVVPRLLTELAGVARLSLGAGSVLVHLNNLENLTDEAADHAARVLRDLRDACFLVGGYHWLVVGTTEAIRHVVSGVPQLRSAFAVPRPLGPLSYDELVELLGKRYEHLRLDPKQPMREPVERDALRELYALFAGDLRGTLRALDQAAVELLGYGGAGAAAPMAWADMRPVLRQAYGDELAGALTPTQAGHLAGLIERDVAGAGLASAFTQKDVQTALGVAQSTASAVLADLQRLGYAREISRQPDAEGGSAAALPLAVPARGDGRGRPEGPKGGRPATAYAFTGATRLIYG